MGVREVLILGLGYGTNTRALLAHRTWTAFREEGAS